MKLLLYESPSQGESERRGMPLRDDKYATGLRKTNYSKLGLHVGLGEQKKKKKSDFRFFIPSLNFRIPL